MATHTQQRRDLKNGEDLAIDIWLLGFAAFDAVP